MARQARVAAGNAFDFDSEGPIRDGLFGVTETPAN
jgi:hypothetical protein